MSLRRLFVFLSLVAFSFATNGFSQEPEENTPATEKPTPSGPHAEYFATLDTDGNGEISGEEVIRLPELLKRSYVSGQNPRQVVIDFEEFHNDMERYARRLIEDRERVRLESEAKKDQFERDLAFARYRKSLVAADPDPSVEKTGSEQESITLETSPHADYFRHFDKNNDGVLDGDEKGSLPQTMIQYLDDHFPDAWRTNQITIREFHDHWESEQKSWKRRQEMTSKNERYENYRTKLLLGDKVAAEAARHRAAEKNTPPKKEAPPKAEPENEAVKSMTVEIVMLRRTSGELPGRTLASEVLEVLGNDGPSLSARLLAWLADPNSKQVELLDYIQGQSVEGQRMSIERGGREPYFAGTTSSRRGGNGVSYSTQEMGTVATVDPVVFKETDQVGLAVRFEKSYLDPPPDKIIETTEQPEGSREEAETADEPNDARSGSSPRTSRLAMPPPIHRVPPPALTKMNAEGMLILPAGKAGVLTEVAKQRGESFEEVVILVQWN
ncbi:hypothetical protein [Bremerella alba]|uniref:EF-hand domain-containing protein n=1 Tax=Bremerella alba TaxID=980252 RepID=A0A7V9A9A8_9BACT|nr:hypothetical protein [Bremerella alba]MBA2117262.1 hypothetical protein [Bremerella alba]